MYKPGSSARTHSYWTHTISITQFFYRMYKPGQCHGHNTTCIKSGLLILSYIVKLLE